MARPRHGKLRGPFVIAAGLLTALAPGHAAAAAIWPDVSWLKLPHLSLPAVSLPFIGKSSRVGEDRVAVERRPHVRKVLIQGVDGNKQLRDALDRAIGDSQDYPFNRIEARRRARDAADSAELLLRSEGYYDYSVETDVTETENGRAMGVLKIDPGPRTTFGQINIDWEASTPDELAMQAAFDGLDLKTGAPARAPDVIAAQGRIVAALKVRGYADVQALEPDVVVDHGDRTMNPTFPIQSGGLVRIGDLHFVTDTRRTNPAWVRKLVPWKAGQVYNPQDIALLERRLLDTGVFDSVTLALEPPPAPTGSVATDGSAPQTAPAPNRDAGLRSVDIALVERAKHSLDFTAGYSTSEGSSFDVRWSDYNRFRSADTLTYEARLAQIDSRIDVAWSQPHWFSPGQTLKLDVQGFRTVTDAYTERGEVVSANLTRRFQTTSYISEGVSLTSSTESDETGRLNINTLRLLGVLALDHSDNPLDPHKGWKLEIHVTPTQIEGDEEIGYIKSQIQVSSYLPLVADKSWLIAGKVHVGSIWGGQIPAVPAADRFFAGGGESVRGFSYLSIGPHYPDDTPKGGLSIAEGALELRQRFGTSPIGWVLFADAGSVASAASPDFSHFNASVGIGFRYHLGFAPIRADIAVPLENPGGIKQKSFQIYLSIGQAF